MNGLTGTGSNSVSTKDAFVPRHRRNHSLQPCSPSNPASRFTRPPAARPVNATSSRNAVDTSPDPPLPTSASRPMSAGKSSTSSSSPFATAQRTSSWIPSISLPALPARVPRPRLNLTYFHGVFAPNCKHREHIVPRHQPKAEAPDKPLAPLTPMQRWKRVFAIDPNAARSRPARSVAASCV